MREVPQASMGFSPFELLYGQQPRGLLEVLRKEWETPSATKKSPASFLEALHQRLKATYPTSLARIRGGPRGTAGEVQCPSKDTDLPGGTEGTVASTLLTQQTPSTVTREKS